MKVTMSGNPSLVSGISTSTGAALMAGLVAAQAQTTDFAQLANDVLAALQSEAVVVIEPNSRKVYAASAGQSLVNLRDVASASGVLGVVTLTPDADQVGTSLMFTRSGSGNVNDELDVLADTLVEAAKPKRSLAAIVTAFLNRAYTGKPPVIIVDQPNGVIKVVDIGAATTGIDSKIAAAISDKDEDFSAIALNGSNTSDTPTTGATKLVFEGGAV